MTEEPALNELLAAVTRELLRTGKAMNIPVECVCEDVLRHALHVLSAMPDDNTGSVH